MDTDQRQFEDDDRQRNISDATRGAEEEDFEGTHNADRPPTSDEDAVLDDRSVDPAVRERYNEMTERGRNERGEGRID